MTLGTIENRSFFWIILSLKESCLEDDLAKKGLAVSKISRRGRGE